jgi:hypothetical protein
MASKHVQIGGVATGGAGQLELENDDPTEIQGWITRVEGKLPMTVG